MEKKTIRKFVAVEGQWALHHLPDGTRLEWVPGYEEHLQYAPDDIKNDRCLRLWHTFRSKMHGGRRMRYEIKPTLILFRHDRNAQRPRVRIEFRLNGKMQHLYRTHLTMQCIMGFAIADRRHWVVDHINGITVDDRPSNMQVISQLENCRRSVRRSESQKLSPRANKIAADQRRQWMDKRRLQLMAIMPDADPIDIAFELALEMQEKTHPQTPPRPTPRSPVKERASLRSNTGAEKANEKL